MKLNQLNLARQLAGKLEFSPDGISLNARGLREDEALDFNVVFPNTVIHLRFREKSLVRLSRLIGWQGRRRTNRVKAIQEKIMTVRCSKEPDSLSNKED